MQEIIKIHGVKNLHTNIAWWLVPAIRMMSSSRAVTTTRGRSHMNRDTLSKQICSSGNTPMDLWRSRCLFLMFPAKLNMVTGHIVLYSLKISKRILLYRWKKKILRLLTLWLYLCRAAGQAWQGGRHSEEWRPWPPLPCIVSSSVSGTPSSRSSQTSPSPCLADW